MLEGLVIRTASLRELNKLPKSGYRVLVTRLFPFYIKGLKGKISEWLPMLAPTKELFERYKNELNRTKDPKLAWALARVNTYFRLYVLRDSDALYQLKRIRDIGRKLKGRRVVYLISHEVSDECSHRGILKELMEKYEL